MLLFLLLLGSSVEGQSPRAVIIPGTAGQELVLDPAGAELVIELDIERPEELTLAACSFDADVTLCVQAANGDVLAQDEDSGRESDAVLHFLPPGAGRYRLVLMAPAAAGSVTPHVLRGARSFSPRDEQRAALAYWQVAWSRALERDDGARAQLALERLAALQPGTPQPTLEERLFDAQDRRLAARELLSAGDAAFRAGNPDAARAQLKELGSLLNAGERAADAPLLDVLLEASDLAFRLSDWRAMLAFAERAHAIAGATLGVDEPLAVVAAFRHGLALRNGNQYGLARECLEESYARWLAALTPDADNVRIARGELGSLLAQLGEIPRGRSLLEENYAACTRVLSADAEETLLARLNLATVCAQSGDFASARALGESLLEWAGRLPEADLRAVNLKMMMAGTLKHFGEYHRSRQLMEEVVEARAKHLPGDDFGLALARTNLSTLRDLDGDAQGARAELERVITVLEERLDPREVTLQAARANLAVMRREQGDLAGARVLQERALAALAGLDDHALTALLRHERCLTVLSDGDDAGLAQALSDLAHTLEVHFAHGAFLAPREAAAERAELFSELGTLLSLTPDAHPELLLRAFCLVESGRSLALGMAARSRVISADAHLTELERRVSVAHRKSAAAAAAVQGLAPAGVGASLALLEATRERDAAERALGAALAESGTPFLFVEAAALARRLEPQTAAVSFVRYRGLPAEAAERARRDEFLAFVLLPTGGLQRVRLGPAAEIETAVADWRLGLARPLQESGSSEPLLAGPVRSIGGTRPAPPDPLPAPGEALRVRVLDPILAALPEGTRTLVICLDDVLGLVPLDALPLGSGVVGDRIRIEVQPCLGQLLVDEVEGEERVEPGEPLALLAGNITYGAGSEAGMLAALPGSAAEITAVGEQLRAVGARLQILTGAEASKDAFVHLAPRAHFLHVATHGYASTDEDGGLTAGLLPLSLCGLTFAGARIEDGKALPAECLLTAEELAGLDLRRAELVVLSACDTRVGLRRAGQVLQSFATALAIAGARSSLTSLWAVDDAAARALMEEFYRRVFVEHQDRAGALWEAKRSMRTRAAPLSDWAGWTLAGDGGPLVIAPR